MVGVETHLLPNLIGWGNVIFNQLVQLFEIQSVRLVLIVCRAALIVRLPRSISLYLLLVLELFLNDQVFDILGKIGEIGQIDGRNFLKTEL